MSREVAAKDRIAASTAAAHFLFAGLILWRCRAPASSCQNAMHRHLRVLLLASVLRKSKPFAYASRRSALLPGLRNDADGPLAVRACRRDECSKWSMRNSEGCRRKARVYYRACGLDWDAALSCVSRDGSVRSIPQAWSQVRKSILPALSGVVALLLLVKASRALIDALEGTSALPRMPGAASGRQEPRSTGVREDLSGPPAPTNRQLKKSENFEERTEAAFRSGQEAACKGGVELSDAEAPRFFGEKEIVLAILPRHFGSLWGLGSISP